MTGEKVTLVLGGARSGKTAYALSLCERYRARVYVATAQARDEEMRERIAAHRVERGSAWQTIEEPLALGDALHCASGDKVVSPVSADETVVLVDCLTLWLSNLMEAERDLKAETEALISALERCRCSVVLVSNEVGMGLVPQTSLGRAFRDAQGRLNQEIARVADEAVFVAAGLPMRLKL